MAISATVIKADLNISNIDDHYYQTHHLTLAKHPSENDTRMMLRLIAFGLYADNTLEFTRGLSSDDEPELWQKNLIDDIELWIELGQPDEKRLRKACHKADQVVVFSYGERASQSWWSNNQGKLSQLENLTIIEMDTETYEQLQPFAQRHIKLNLTIQDKTVFISDDLHSLEWSPNILKS